MEVSFQRRVDHIAGVAICRILSWLPRARRRPPPGFVPKKILVILLSEMGALVLAQPMFRRIREKFPISSTFALVFQQNKEVLDLIGVLPPENILTVRNSSFVHFLKDSFHAIRTLRRIGVDAVIDGELFSRVSSIFSFLSGAAVRVGFHPFTQEGLFRGDFINRPVLYNPYQHMAHQYITLVEAIGSNGAPASKRPVGDDDLTIVPISVEPAEIATMSERLHRDFPQARGKKIVLVNPGGGLLPIRAWPLSYFCRLAEKLVERDCIVAVIGLSRDKDAARAILSHCRSPYAIDLTGYTRTVRELMALFHLSSLLITNDGGPGHFASLTPIPSIVFYGPETPALYRPLDNKSVTFYSGLSCSPCLTAYNHRNSPCDGNNVCLQSIHHEKVLEVSMRVLFQEGVAGRV